jgi:hypothetical protein
MLEVGGPLMTLMNVLGYVKQKTIPVLTGYAKAL